MQEPVDVTRPPVGPNPRCHRPPDPAVGIDWPTQQCLRCSGDLRRPWTSNTEEESSE